MEVILGTTAMSTNNDRWPMDPEQKCAYIFSNTSYIEYLMECAHLYHMESPQGYNIYLINLGLRLLHLVETYDTQDKHKWCTDTLHK